MLSKVVIETPGLRRHPLIQVHEDVTTLSDYLIPCNTFNLDNNYVGGNEIYSLTKEAHEYLHSLNEFTYYLDFGGINWDRKLTYVDLYLNSEEVATQFKLIFC